MKILVNTGWLILLILSVVGCKTAAVSTSTGLQLPDTFRFTATADTATIADLQWKELFKDTVLQGLIEKGIRQNFDLQIALKQLDAAEQTWKQAKYIQFPELSLGITAQTSKPSANSMNGQTLNMFLKQNHVEDYNLAANLSWEADIWGKMKKEKEVAKLGFLQTYEVSKAIQTRVVADIARMYYDLQMLDKQLAIARTNLKLNGNTLSITRSMYQHGEATSLAVQQTTAQQQSTELLIAALEQQVAIRENALSVLVGEVPGNINRPMAASDNPLLQYTAGGVPAGMVSRRPDVRQQELALLASNARVGINQANMYPALRITASGGLNSFQFNNWFTMPASLFGSVLGGITQPVFQKRQLKTNFEIAKIQREEQVFVFRQSVMNALKEVADALVANAKLEIQERKAVEQVKTLEEAIASAQLLYKEGSVNYLEVISAQASSLQAELNLASLKTQRLNSVVDLYKALGGGWK